MQKMLRVHAIITGGVQGVFFRVETKYAAERFNVTGWVRNKRDGSVEAVMEGDEDQVNALLSWCQDGPPRSRVDNVVVIRQDYTGEFETFDVTY